MRLIHEAQDGVRAGAAGLDPRREPSAARSEGHSTLTE